MDVCDDRQWRRLCTAGGRHCVASDLGGGGSFLWLADIGLGRFHSGPKLVSRSSKNRRPDVELRVGHGTDFCLYVGWRVGLEKFDGRTCSENLKGGMKRVATGVWRASAMSCRVSNHYNRLQQTQLRRNSPDVHMLSVVKALHGFYHMITSVS
jgi:hypothetical protein